VSHRESREEVRSVFHHIYYMDQHDIRKEI
jgi:hypothetical protein